ncbi:MAG TPA: DUF2723 domain-containing protein [Phycisphaerae bacterium]|nr:DUF2723 domain-containing protein [Phycisphaerae bacterium]HRW54993.1 DUF2723 domain-containing protein [Phycisphaerae bacterium]
MPDPREAPRNHIRFIWWIAFVAACLLFAATTNRGAQWQDSGLHQVRIITNDITNRYGIATSHPLHFYIGRIFRSLLPIEPGFAISLVSALAGAITVANIALLVMRFTRNAGASAIAAIALAFCHTFWQHATHTETYTIVAALLTAEWLCIERYLATRRGRWLVLLFLANGLGVANHMLAAFATLADATLLSLAIVKRQVNWKLLFACAAIWIVGCVPLLEYMVRDYLFRDDLGRTIHSALFGEYADSVLNTSVSIRSLAMGFGFIVYNFPGVAIPLAIYGVARGRRRIPDILRRILLVEAAIYTLFVLRYSIVDQYSYFFIIYLFVALFAGVGVERLREWMRPRTLRIAYALAFVTALWTPIVYLAAAHLLEKRQFMAGAIAGKPYRDGYRSFFVPWGAGDNHADVLNEVLADRATPKTTIVLEDRMMAFGVQYAQALHRLNPSTRVVVAADLPDVSRDITLATGPVILVPRDRGHPQVEPDLPWRRDGDIYILDH